MTSQTPHFSAAINANTDTAIVIFTTTTIAIYVLLVVVVIIILGTEIKLSINCHLIHLLVVSQDKEWIRSCRSPHIR